MPEPPRLQDERYELQELIGDGAVATVWRARDKTSGASVAIKLMRPKSFDLEDVQRLAQEVEILRKLNHPSIVRLFDTGVDEGGNPYIAMEHVKGITLRAKLDTTPILPIADVAEIIGQICSGLADAHEQGVIHRDIKPENVLLCAPEHVEVKLVDFGMAKVNTREAPDLTLSDKIFGTPQYMAPERALGQPVGPATDVYAVGILAYEMLQGQRPFDGKNPIAILTAHINAVPPPLTRVSPAIASVIGQALAKSAKDRPSAREFSARLVQGLIAAEGAS
jgi:serine/threonine protein kinase